MQDFGLLGADGEPNASQAAYSLYMLLYMASLESAFRAQSSVNRKSLTKSWSTFVSARNLESLKTIIPEHMVLISVGARTQPCFIA